MVTERAKTLEPYQRGAPCPGGRSLQGRVESQWAAASTPRFMVGLLAVIGLYVLWPVAELPFITVSLSAPLFALLGLEVLRRPNLWRWGLHGAIFKISATLVFGLLTSYFASILGTPVRLEVFDVALGLRLPYWVMCMVLTAIVVAQTRNPMVYVKALGWGVVALGALRLSAFVGTGQWRMVNVMGLTQNTYGLIFSTFWPFALWLFLWGQRRLVAGVGAAVVLAAIAINGSRGSWLTVVVTTAGALALWSVDGTNRLRGRLGGVAGLIAVAALVATIASQVIPEEGQEYFRGRAETFSELDADSSYQTRVAMRNKAVTLFLARPLLGVGPGFFTKVDAEFELPMRLTGKSLGDLNTKSAHSAYFQLLAEAGLAGTIPFGVLLAFLLFRGSFAAIRLARKGVHWPVPVVLGFLGMSLHLVAISGLLGTMPWFIYGLVAGLVAWERWAARRPTGQPAGLASVSRSQVARLGSVTLRPAFAMGPVFTGSSEHQPRRAGSRAGLGQRVDTIPRG